MSDPNEKVQEFVDRLRDRFVAGGLDPDSDAPLRIQISSRVPYREGENSVNKLTDADMAIIEAALDSSSTAEPDQSAVIDKAINIDLGCDRVFRYKNGVEIDTFKPIAVETVQSVAPLEQNEIEALQEPNSTEILNLSESSFDLDAIAADFNGLLVTDDDLSRISTAEAATDAALADLGMARADAIVPNEESYVDPEIAAAVVDAQVEDFDVDLSDLDFDRPDAPPVSAPDFNSIDTLIDRKVAEVEAASEPDQSAAPAAASQVKYFINAQPQQVSEPAESPAASAPDKLPAAAIAWAQLADKLPEGSKEWLKQANDQFATVADSSFGRTVQEQGAAAAKAAWTQITSLGEQAKNRAIADSIVALTKEFGSSQEQDGQKNWVYQSEGFKVEVKGTNSYQVSDQEGNQLLSFKADRWRGATQMESNLTPMQAFDIVQAGAELSAVKAWDGAQQVASKTKDATQHLIDRTQQLADRLGNLAPQGTRQQLVGHLDRQSGQLAEALATSKEAIQTAAGTLFDGKPFRALKSAATEAVGLLREGVEGTVLKQEAGGGIRSRLGLPDLKMLGQLSQQVQQRVEQSIAVVAGAGKSRDQER